MARRVNRLISIAFYLCNVFFISSLSLRAMEQPGPLKPVFTFDSCGWEVKGIVPFGTSKLFMYNQDSFVIWDYKQTPSFKVISFGINKVKKVLKLDESHVLLVPLNGNNFYTLNIEETDFPDISLLFQSRYSVVAEAFLLGDRSIGVFIGCGVVEVWDFSSGIFIYKSEFFLNQSKKRYSKIISNEKNCVFLLTSPDWLKDDWSLLIGNLDDQRVDTMVVPNRNRIKECTGHLRYDIASICYCDDEHIAFGWTDGSISIWNFKDKKQIKLKYAHDDGMMGYGVSSLIRLDKCHVVSGGCDEIVRVMTVDLSEFVACNHIATQSEKSDCCLELDCKQLEIDYNRITSSNYSPDDRVISIVCISDALIASVTKSCVQIFKIK